MTDDQQKRIDDLEKRLVDAESMLGHVTSTMAQRVAAIPPPRPPSQSLVDLVVSQAGEQLAEQFAKQVQEQIVPKFDSFGPLMLSMNEEQLEIGRRAERERAKRAEHERRWAGHKRLALAAMVCITAVCELARALLTH